MCAKPSERNWKMRVEDILDCIDKINRYTAGMDFDVFRADGKTIDAVIRNLEIIGEAASHIPEEIQARYPDLGWFEMRGIHHHTRVFWGQLGNYLAYDHQRPSTISKRT